MEENAVDQQEVNGKASDAANKIRHRIYQGAGSIEQLKERK